MIHGSETSNTVWGRVEVDAHGRARVRHGDLLFPIDRVLMPHFGRRVRYRVWTERVEPELEVVGRVGYGPLQGHGSAFGVHAESRRGEMPRLGLGDLVHAESELLDLDEGVTFVGELTLHGPEMLIGSLDGDGEIHSIESDPWAVRLHARPLLLSATDGLSAFTCEASLNWAYDGNGTNIGARLDRVSQSELSPYLRKGVLSVLTLRRADG